MCGRYLFTDPPEVVAATFTLSGLPTLRPRYNIAPSQSVPVVGLKPDGQTRGLRHLKWGFVPHWANDPNEGPKPINAMSETVATNGLWKQSFAQKRCLIPASGFYEWKTVGRRKLGHVMRPRNGKPLAFAGVWDVWGEHPNFVFTCAILTVPANNLLKDLHHRMPAILTRDDFAAWLDPATPIPDLLKLLVTRPDDELSRQEVGPAVNSWKIDSPECLRPAEPDLFTSAAS